MYNVGNLTINKAVISKIESRISHIVYQAGISYNRAKTSCAAEQELSLIIIESKNSGAAKQAVIHVDFTGVVVRIRIPETS